MKKHLFLLILISPLLLGACDFPGSNKIPETVPPALVIPEEGTQIPNQVRDDKDSEDVEEPMEEVSEAEVKALKYEVILPSEERETERLLEEYQAALDNIETNLK